MPYTLLHKAATRSRILHVARYVFAFKGFAATSIDDVMRAGGMTRGAFYAHFESKAALYKEAMHMPYDAEQLHGVLDQLASIIDQGNRAGEANLGPLPLVNDMLSEVPEVREVVEQALLRLIGSAAQTTDRGRALAIISMGVGAAVLLQSVSDRQLTADIRSACIATASGALQANDQSDEPTSVLWAPDTCGRRSG